MHILLVEDHDDSAIPLAQLLLRHGYRVDRALTAGEAKALCRENRYDLMISDLGLPDQSGWDLLADLRRTCTMPAIALSGRVADDEVRRSHAAGFIAHITKPVRFSELLASIKQIIETTPPDSQQPRSA